MTNNQSRRKSVGTLVYTFLAFVLISFIISASLSYYKLVAFQTVLTRFTTTSFPEVMRSGKASQQVSELSLYAESLTHALSSASLRIAADQIDTKIAAIKDTINQQKFQKQLLNHLNIVATEFNSLNELVEKRLEINNKISILQHDMYQLHERPFDLTSNKAISNADKVRLNNWELEFSSLIVSSSEVLTSQRLQRVRLILKKVEVGVANLHDHIGLLPKIYRLEATKLTQQLNDILLPKQGLFALKILQLRITGRAIGRGNFVKHMSDEFARLMQLRSHEINNVVVQQTAVTATWLAQQTKIIGTFSFVVLLLLFAAIYYIKTRLVTRLKSLNKQIKARQAGDDVEVSISGNDEISDIAASFSYFANKVEEQQSVLLHSSRTDGLTKLANRSSLDERLHDEIERSKRSKLDVAVLLLDIDHFKKYNDNYGHIAGDECLKNVATILKNSLKRSTDFVARYGGEEFVFILPDTDLVGANIFAKTVLKNINDANLKHEHSLNADHITISIGVTAFNHRYEIAQEALLQHADEALYMAKDSGRDCIRIYDSVDINFEKLMSTGM